MSLSTLLSFTPGASNDDMVCTNVTLASDELVECEEEFSLVLTLSTEGDNLFLGNSVTAITLLDSDGKTQ